MSWFGKDQKHILKHAEYSTILAAEIVPEGAGRKIAKLLYTGHDGLTDKGAIQAIAPGHGGIWHTTFAEEYDVRDGHVVPAGDLVVTRQRDGSKKHIVLAHEIWTGKERWKLQVGQMVSRMGIDGNGELLFVTMDHQVHGVNVASGQDTLRQPVMTDEARDGVLARTRHPISPLSSGSRTTSSNKDWSHIYEPLPGLEVRERSWSGTTEFAVQDHLIGQGSYEGALQYGDLTVVAFKLERDEGRHHHWYLFARDPVELLGILREDGSSEFFAGGQSFWKGKL